jgi:hypothetical protein
LGRQARNADYIARLIARVKCFRDTEDERIWLAYRYGREAAKVARHREKGRAA